LTAVGIEASSLKNGMIVWQVAKGSLKKGMEE
jgi:hypothetical protein